MITQRVLVANEPRAYREALAGALTHLRPGLRVQLLEPAVLDDTAAQLRPALVVCSQLSAAVRTHAGAWLLLYPEGAERAAIGAGDWGQVLPSSDFATVLDVLDATLATPATADLPRPVWPVPVDAGELHPH